MSHSRRPGFRVACLLCGLSADTSRSLHSQTDAARPQNEIVVSATGLEEEAFEVPYSAHSLDGNVLTSQKAYRTLPDALREIPGAMVQKTSSGQGSPYLRGFTGYRTLLLIDGIRLNSAVMRDGPNQYWNTVDPLTIERLEVVKGPSSVLHGSDAIGGTVNVVTQSQDPSPGDAMGSWFGDVFWSRRLYYRFASGEQSHVARAESSVAVDGKLGLTGGASYRDVGDIIGGKHTGALNRTDYDELDGDVKAVWRVAPDTDLIFAYQRVSQEDVPRTHSTVFSQSFRGTSVGTDLRRELDQSRRLGYVQLHKKNVADWLSRISISLSHHEQDEEEIRVQSNSRRTVQGFDDGVTGAWIQLESPSPIGTLSYGVEYYHDNVDAHQRVLNPDGTLRSRSARGPVADEARYDQLGIYAQDSVEIVKDRFEVILGGRYNFVHAAASEMDPDLTDSVRFGKLSEDYDAVVGSLRGLVHATADWNFFGGASQGFRAPNLSDLTRFDVARSGEQETPAPDLDPEKYLTFEGGTRVRNVDWGYEAYVAYHYTVIQDMIVRFPTGNTVNGLPEVTKDNVGDGFVQGVDLGLSWNFFEGFTAFGSFAWLEGEADTFVGASRRRKPLSRIQPASSLIGLRWDSKSKKYFVEGTALIADDQHRLSPDDKLDNQRIPPGGTPGYTVYTLRLGTEVTRGLNVFAAVENIMDRDYRILGSGQNEPGTNVILGADWRF